MIWTFTCRKAVCGKMRFSYNYKNGKEEIICYSSMNDFDGISYGIMQDERELFLPVEVSEEAGKYVFTYNMLGMVNLRAWMNDASGNCGDAEETLSYGNSGESADHRGEVHVCG